MFATHGRKVRSSDRLLGERSRSQLANLPFERCLCCSRDHDDVRGQRVIGPATQPPQQSIDIRRKINNAHIACVFAQPLIEILRRPTRPDVHPFACKLSLQFRLPIGMGLQNDHMPRLFTHSAILCGRGRGDNDHVTPTRRGHARVHYELIDLGDGVRHHFVRAISRIGECIPTKWCLTPSARRIQKVMCRRTKHRRTRPARRVAGRRSVRRRRRI